MDEALGEGVQGSVFKLCVTHISGLVKLVMTYI